MSPRYALAAIAVALAAGLADGQVPPPMANSYSSLTGRYQVPSANGSVLAAGSALYPQLPVQPVNYLEAPPSAGWSEPSYPSGDYEDGRRRRRILTDGTDPTDPKCSFEAEFLIFQLKGIDPPISLANSGGPGSFGLPGGTSVRPVGDLGDNTHSGGRISGGVWINPQCGYGVEASAFIFEEKGGSESLRSNAAGNLTLARPFFDTVTGTQNVRLVSLPGAFAGGVSVEATTLFWGAEYTPVFRIMQRERSSLDLIGGFRFYSLEEAVSVTDSTTALANGRSTFLGQEVAGTSVAERFSTQNRFYGAVFGARYNLGYERVTLNLIAKLGVGATREFGRVGGTTTVVGGAGFADGGLLAQTTNSGRGKTTEFSIAPDLMAKLWYNVGPGFAVYGGYNVLYLSDVQRPGDLIDPAVNPNRVPSGPNFGTAGGGGRPVRMNASSEFWAHGASAGIMLIY